jgi:protein-tyrosine kinase
MVKRKITGVNMSTSQRQLSRAENKKSLLDKKRAKEILLNEESPFHVKEAYKALRTNVMFSVSANKGKVIGITSAVSGEGKSTTALNLAITFAETGSRVILIDADMRRPNIKRIMGVEAESGLAEVLARFSPLEDAIQTSPFKNLDILYSGATPPNPVELLGSKAMETLIEAFKGYYDYIFIDTPPVIVVTDATVLAKLLDGIILVVRENASKRDEVLYAVSKLQFVGAKVIGTVLNDKTFHAKRGYGYGKYKSYNRKHYAEPDNN